MKQYLLSALFINLCCSTVKIHSSEFEKRIVTDRRKLAASEIMKSIKKGLLSNTDFAKMYDSSDDSNSSDEDLILAQTITSIFDESQSHEDILHQDQSGYSPTLKRSNYAKNSRDNKKLALCIAAIEEQMESMTFENMRVAHEMRKQFDTSLRPHMQRSVSLITDFDHDASSREILMHTPPENDLQEDDLRKLRQRAYMEKLLKNRQYDKTQRASALKPTRYAKPHPKKAEKRWHQ